MICELLKGLNILYSLKESIGHLMSPLLVELFARNNGGLFTEERPIFGVKVLLTKDEKRLLWKRNRRILLQHNKPIYNSTLVVTINNGNRSSQLLIYVHNRSIAQHSLPSEAAVNVLPLLQLIHHWFHILFLTVLHAEKYHIEYLSIVSSQHMHNMCDVGD